MLVHWKSRIRKSRNLYFSFFLIVLRKGGGKIWKMPVHHPYSYFQPVGETGEPFIIRKAAKNKRLTFVV